VVISTKWAKDENMGDREVAGGEGRRYETVIERDERIIRRDSVQD